jgi:CRP-like cAMP-binding protein
MMAKRFRAAPQTPASPGNTILDASNELQPSVMKAKLFAGLAPAALSEILRVAAVRHIEGKKNLILREQSADHLFLLQRGRARAYVVTQSGAEILLLWVVPGMALGLVSLLQNPPTYKVNVTTTSDCEFLVWDRQTLRKLVNAYPDLSENAFRLSLEYLERYMKRHVNLLTETAESRLAQKIVQLATEAGVVRPSGITIEITNEQLSSLADIGPFTTSRLLSKWERERVLSKMRGRVTLFSPESLVQSPFPDSNATTNTPFSNDLG